MSFDLIERSIDLGKPIRLYKFMRGTVVWAYNTSRVDIVYQTINFKSLAISDSGIRQTGDAMADAFEITAPRNIEIAQLFRGVAPSDEIEVYVYDMHYGDAEAIISYVGCISSVKFPAQDRCTIVCNTDAISLSGMALRFGWERGCQYVWGDDLCAVSKTLFRVEALLQDATGLSVSSGTFASYDDGYFTGGYIEWSIGNGLYETRFVTSHTGSTLELLGGSSGLGADITVNAYPGCRLTFDDCVNKFSNGDNYGGAADQPGINPFSGDPIF